MGSNHINTDNVNIVRSTPKEVFEELLSGDTAMNLEELGKKFGVCQTTIKRRLSELGLHTKRNYDKFAKFNIHKFDTIDTEEKAYWLGFLYADGCVVSKRHVVSLRLAEVDYDHLLKFKAFLEDTRDNDVIKKEGRTLSATGKTYYSFEYHVNSEYFKKSLITLGCVPKKSLVLKFPDINIFSNPKLVYDFIRGYVDGDGCISEEKGRIAISILGTEDFLLGVQSYLPNFKSVLRYNNNGLHRVRCTSHKADEVTYKLYGEATIYLERKYEKFAALCRKYSSETSGKNGEG